MRMYWCFKRNNTLQWQPEEASLHAVIASDIFQTISTNYSLDSLCVRSHHTHQVNDLVKNQALKSYSGYYFLALQNQLWTQIVKLSCKPMDNITKKAKWNEFNKPDTKFYNITLLAFSI